MDNNKMVCLFVDVELAKEMMQTEIELVRDVLQFAETLEDVQTAHHRLTNVMKCLQDIEAREKRED